MAFTLRLLGLGLLASLTACGGGADASGEGGSVGTGASGAPPTTGSEAAAPRPAPEGPIADVPFTAAQIRDATPAGRTYVYRFREGMGTPWQERWVFSEVSEDGFVLLTTRLDEEGAEVGEAQRSEGTWAELEGHAHLPAGQTEIGRAQVTMPVGTFRCSLYTVSSEDDQGRPVRERYWFALDLPGAPIRMVREVDGESAREMQLVGHEPPIAAP